MAISKAAVTVLASQSVAAGSSKTSPGATGSAIDLRTYYGGKLTWKITNGASAPGVPLSLTVQTSHDGINWYDEYTVSGDTTASSINSGGIDISRAAMYLRAIACGNTTNAVTVESYFQEVTGL